MNRQFEYQRDLDGLRFTPEQKAQIAARAAEAAAKQARRPHRPIRRTALIAAALIAALTVGAGASGVLRPVTDVFAPVFGGGAAETEIIDKIGHPIGASATDNGITVTADAIIGDKYNACIVYTISRDDGTPLLPEGTETRQLLIGGTGGTTLSGFFGGSHGSAWFVDEVPGDNAIQYVETISSDAPLNKGTARAEFDGLYRFDEAREERVSLLEGHWSFRFDMNYEDASVTLGNGETFEQDGMTFTVNEITVSPVAIRVDYTVDSEVQWSNAPSGRQSDEDRQTTERYFESVEILLTKTDGTVLDLSNSGGSISPGDGVTHCIKGRVLDEIVPLEELESICVGGVVYPILKN